jgi:hypothetical protein
MYINLLDTRRLRNISHFLNSIVSLRRLSGDTKCKLEAWGYSIVARTLRQTRDFGQQSPERAIYVNDGYLAHRNIIHVFTKP